MFTFLHLGANSHEQTVGQNVKIDLSIQIPYEGTQDKLSQTVDYGRIIERVQQFIEATDKINLLEYLAEQVLNMIHEEFNDVKAAKLTIHKAFVPIAHFTGSVAIEVFKEF